MKMMRLSVSRVSRISVLMACALVALPGVALAEWTKTYAIEWSEPALYYGGEGGPAEPATDCPKGANPDPDWTQIMIDAGYSPEQARWINDPGNMALTRQQIMNQRAFRGKNRANVLADPTAVDDPGFPGVEGDIGEGINLDGDTETGFTSPTGEKGVDNQFYKALGCWKYYRGMERQSASSMLGNDFMRNGAWTVVMVVSGQGNDPMNDDNVSVGIYMSPDKLVKDANGNIGHDYTFRLMPHKKYEAIFKGNVKNGRITTEPSPEIFFRDSGYGPGIELLQARVDLQMQPDGTLTGYVGGYRSWQGVFDQYVEGRGVIVEIYDGIRLPALWYAVRRHADYSPAGADGEKTHISYAQEIVAVPAYIADSEGKELVTSVKSYKGISKNGELFYYPRKTESRPFKGGLILQPGETDWKPLSDEELTPPEDWLKNNVAANAGENKE